MLDVIAGEERCFVRRLSHEFNQIQLVPTSDVHYGNHMFSHKWFKAHLKAIQTTPNMFTVLNGDLCESTIKSSKGDIFQQVGTPQDQRDWTIEQWYPIRDKVLAVSMGNHERRIYNETGIDLCADIAKALGVPYRAEGFFLRLHFGSGNDGHPEKQYVYTGYFTHGFGGARTSAAKAVKVERTSTQVHADYYCLPPQTKVLSGGLVWRELGDVRVGDELMGVSESPEFNQTRRVLHTCVTDVRNRFAQTLRVTLEDGTCVTTTPDHLWLTRRRPSGTTLGGRYNWYRADSLSVGDELMQVFPVWESRNDWETGYISGLLDGEGSITVSGGERRTRNATFSQKEGEVMAYFEGYLQGNAIRYRKYVRDDGVAQLVFSVDAPKLLGMTQPIRLREKVRLLAEKRIHKPKLLRIVDIAPVGRREVVTIETDAHTFIAEGLATHNCMSHDHVVNAAPTIYLIPDTRSSIVDGFEVAKVKAVRKMLVKSNAFLKWGGYSEMGGFPPVDLETPIIFLWGEGKPKVRVLV